MAERRNFFSERPDENGNRRQNNIGLDTAREMLSTFMASKRTELRRLTNDPERAPIARLIKVTNIRLQNQLTYNSFLIYFPRRVMEMVYQFEQQVERFLRSDGKIASRNKLFNYNLLDAAIATGYINTIKRFLQAGFDINSTYNTSITRFCIPLHRAAENRQTKALEFLIQHGASVNMPNYMGKTALFYAVEADDLQSVEYLLAARAELNDPDILTAGVLNKNVQIVEILIKAGANPRQRDLCGRTPLHFTTGHKKHQVFQFPFECEDLRRAEVAKLLIERGADVNARTTTGITPLHAAALKGYSKVAEVLLTYGASVDLPFTDGKTALFFASFNAYSLTVSVLFKFGADINTLDVDEKSALNMAHTAGSNRYTMICNPYDARVNIVLRSANLMEEDEYESEHYIDYDHYDVDFYLQSRGRTIDILEQHIVKLLTVGMVVREELKALINIYATATFQTECEKELKMMQNMILFNEITGLDIAQMDLNTLALFTRNLDILDVLERYNYENALPIYGGMIKYKIQVSVKKNAATSAPLQFGIILVMPGFSPLFPIYRHPLIIE